MEVEVEVLDSPRRGGTARWTEVVASTVGVVVVVENVNVDGGSGIPATLADLVLPLPAPTWRMFVIEPEEVSSAVGIVLAQVSAERGGKGKWYACE